MEIPLKTHTVNPRLKSGKDVLENLLFKVEDDLTKVIAVREQAKLDKNRSVLTCSLSIA